MHVRKGSSLLVPLSFPIHELFLDLLQAVDLRQALRGDGPDVERGDPGVVPLGHRGERPRGRHHRPQHAERVPGPHRLLRLRHEAVHQAEARHDHVEGEDLPRVFGIPQVRMVQMYFCFNVSVLCRTLLDLLDDANSCDPIFELSQQFSWQRQ